jgi:hypothetical protein
MGPSLAIQQFALVAAQRLPPVVAQAMYGVQLTLLQVLL